MKTPSTQNAPIVATDLFDGFFVTDTERTVVPQAGDRLPVPSVLPSRSTVELLAFWVGNEEYALEIAHIQEIIKRPQITGVPRVNPVVLGIISLRGTIVPIVDLRRTLRLGPEAPTRFSRILVLRSESDPLGLLVDRVTSVVRLDRDSIEPTPPGMRHDTDLLEGLGRVGARLLIVMDVLALLSSMEKMA